MHKSKYALNVLCIPFLCSKFTAQDLSHVQLWRTAIEYHAASNSSHSGMPIFGWTGAFFCMEKKRKKSKSKPPDSTVEQSQPAVKCCL